MEFDEKTLSSNKVFSGKFIDLRVDKVLLPNGKTSTREIITHPGAVAMVALNEKKEIMMVRQYRKAVEKELLEIPAGKLEKGETIENCARRELMEEIGFYPKVLKYVNSFYTSPGFTDELMHLFLATELNERSMDADEDEFIKVERVPINIALEKVYNGEIMDGKTIAGLLMICPLLRGEN